MNDKVKQYIEEKQKVINEAKRKEHEILLEKLGIYSEKREYATREFTTMIEAAEAGYDKVEKRDEEWVYYRTKKEYGEITDEEYEQLRVLSAGEDNEQPITGVEKSAGAAFMRLFAWIMWIGGIILSIIIAGETGSALMLVCYIAIFLCVGIAFYCLSEVIENINRIAHNTSCWRTMTIKQKQ